MLSKVLRRSFSATSTREVVPIFKEHFDRVVCSGVLEYIRMPEEVLRKISGYGRSVILSYNPLPLGGSKLERLGNGWGWVNHFKKQELENLFDEIGFKWTLMDSHKSGCVIYSLEQTSALGTAY